MKKRIYPLSKSTYYAEEINGTDFIYHPYEDMLDIGDEWYSPYVKGKDIDKLYEILKFIMKKREEGLQIKYKEREMD